MTARGAPPGQPVVPGDVHLGEGGREHGSPVEHDQRSGVRAGPGGGGEGAGERRQRAGQRGAQGGGFAGGERYRPAGQVADVGVVVSLGGLAAARVAAQGDALVAGVLGQVVIGQVHLRLGGLDGEHLAGEAALQRVAPVSQLAQALPPGPPRRQAGQSGQRSGVCAGEVLGLLQRQRAEGE